MRFFVWLFLIGGAAVVLYITKPTQDDYYQKLETRAATVTGVDHDAFSQLRGGDPIDEMVAAQSPFQLLEQTQYDDYYLFSIFTTEYQAPSHDVRRVRTYGIFSTLFSSRKN